MIRKSYFLVLSAVLGGVAIAGHPGGKEGDKFKAMDSNGDGQVSAAEHAAGVSKMFGAMDANGDGFVTAAEMDTHRAGKAKDAKMAGSSADKIGKMDTDGDGRLSAAEYDSGAQSMFTRMDADKNGSLSAAEMHADHGRMHAGKAYPAEKPADKDSGT